MATFVSVRLIGDPRVISLLLVMVFMATSVSFRLIVDPRVISLLLIKVFMATFVSVRLISFRCSRYSSLSDKPIRKKNIRSPPSSQPDFEAC